MHRTGADIKGDKMDRGLFSKATELGAAADCSPFTSTSHCVIKVPNSGTLWSINDARQMERIARGRARISRELMDHSHHRRPGRLRRRICRAICLARASEEHARGTFQRPFTRLPSAAARSSASDCLVDRPKGMGTGRAACLHRSKVSLPLTPDHESCGPRPQQSQRSASSNQD